MTAWYNEIDPFAVAWLRELIREGVIADGIVDDRSIEDVEPSDLNGFTQCHFFAGIGVWSYALRRAGWSDDRPVWTGSCPCQPFSGAGKEEGFADPRHLWPSWFRLAREHRPVTIFGEQVERAIRSHWLDLVSTDLEAEGYAVGSAVFGAHSVGAPNQRQRVYFVADSNMADAEGRDREIPIPGRRPDEGRSESGRAGRPVGMADDDTGGIAHAEFSGELGRVSDATGGRNQSSDDSDAGAGYLADAVSERRRSGESGRGNATHARVASEAGEIPFVDEWRESRNLRVFADGSATPKGILGGFWDGAEWVECTDGKARPVEPGSFPLAYGSPARVGRLRGYGNAINAEAAVAFVEAYRQVKGEL